MEGSNGTGSEGIYTYQFNTWTKQQNYQIVNLNIKEVVVYGSYPMQQFSAYFSLFAPRNPDLSNIWNIGGELGKMNYWDYELGSCGGWVPETPLAPVCFCCGSKYHLNCECNNKTWDAVTDDRILTLAPCLQDIARDFINYMASRYNIQLRITDAFRDWIDQDADCDRKVSNACGGASYHNYGLAFDVVEISNGEALYTNPDWNLIGQIGESFGLAWGGRWLSPIDKPHFQLATHTTTELLNGALPVINLYLS